MANGPLSAATLQAETSFLAVLDRQAGLRPAFRIRARGQGFAQTSSAADFVDGPARYLACVIDGKLGKTYDARLSVSGSGYLYDCRAGKYLGTAGEHDIKLRAATGNLFALLPSRVQRLDVTAPARASLGRPIDVKVAATIAGGPPFRRVIVLQLRRPDGQDLAQHRWIVETSDGSVSSQLFLALNDPIGPWTLIARDVATGVETAVPIEIQAEGAAGK